MFFLYDVRMTLQDRINELFSDHPEKTPAQLARFLGITATSVSDWMLGKTKKLDVDNAFGVAEFFNANPKWVGTGKGKKYPDKETAVAYNGIQEKIPYYALRRVPIVGNAQLGNNGYWSDLEYPPGFGDGWIDFPTRDGQAFAVRCVGDSMRPRINNGEFVVIEPNAEAMHGDQVLIKAIDGRVMIKTYLYTREGRIYLESINDGHPKISFQLDEVEGIYPVAAIIPGGRWIKNP
jgi:phage repressor protein C with HTH and peptisase S24 domain